MAFLETCSAPLLSLLSFLATGLALLLFIKFFQKTGLYAFIVLALILANIQTLKGTLFPFSSYPIPLGMEAFACVTLAVDILTAYWGPAAAFKAIRLGFAAQATVALLMFLTLSMPAISPQQVPAAEQFLAFNHEHMRALFMPLPGLLVASWLAFVVSQSLDVYIFQRLKKYGLWVRGNVAGLFATFCDHLLFSFLAWIVLPTTPLSEGTFWWSYVFLVYGIRLLYSFLSTPLLYWAGHFIRKP